MLFKRLHGPRLMTEEDLGILSEDRTTVSNEVSWSVTTDWHIGENKPEEFILVCRAHGYGLKLTGHKVRVDNDGFDWQVKVEMMR